MIRVVTVVVVSSRGVYGFFCIIHGCGVFLLFVLIYSSIIIVVSSTLPIVDDVHMANSFNKKRSDVFTHTNGFVFQISNTSFFFDFFDLEGKEESHLQIPTNHHTHTHHYLIILTHK